jgi:hypothetical protein
MMNTQEYGCDDHMIVTAFFSEAKALSCFRFRNGFLSTPDAHAAGHPAAVSGDDSGASCLLHYLPVRRYVRAVLRRPPGRRLNRE